MKRAVSILFVLSVASTAAAQSVTLDQYRPAPTPDDGFALERPTDPGHLRAMFGAHLSYALHPLTFVPEATPDMRVRLVEHQLSLNVTAALGLFDRFLAYVRLPFVLLMEGQTVRGSPEADGAGLGDLTLGARYVLHEQADDMFRLAVSLGVSAPTARAANEGQQLTGEPGAAFWPQLIAEVRPIDILHITATLGGRFREDASPPNLDVSHELTWGLGVGVQVVPEYLELRLETFSSVSLTRFGEAGTTPWELLLGARTEPVDGLTIGLAGSIGLTNGYGNPAFRGVLTVGYALEGEPAPGAPVEEQRVEEVVVVAPAPDTAPIDVEDPRVVEGPRRSPTAVALERDVAPAPPVRAIGVEQRPARIPTELARATGRIPVNAQSQPAQVAVQPPQARAAIRQDPRYRTMDRDGDRVVDADDLCPLDREDYDEIDDQDGCPEENADDDALADVDDHCPLTAGDTRDGACGGCPANACIATGGTIEIGQQVRFATGNDQILPESEGVLRDVLSIVSSNTQILRVRIEGHTDNAGNPESNRQLSLTRARAVIVWLVNHGLHPSRLEGWGCGQDHPIASNNRPAGRTQNRRVEFIIVQPPSGRALRDGCQAVPQ
jgi:outer membrane protein OmpA-like peptidoglycan-associated protein